MFCDWGDVNDGQPSLLLCGSSMASCTTGCHTNPIQATFSMLILLPPNPIAFFYKQRVKSGWEEKATARGGTHRGWARFFFDRWCTQCWELDLADSRRLAHQHLQYWLRITYGIDQIDQTGGYVDMAPSPPPGLPRPKSLLEVRNARPHV